MLASTLIASFFVPMFFVIIESLTERDGDKDVAPQSTPEPASPGGVH
jgi:hypothetical protein